MSFPEKKFKAKLLRNGFNGYAQAARWGFELGWEHGLLEGANQVTKELSAANEKEFFKRKARDAKIKEFIKRQVEDCLVMVRHDDLINPKNEAEIWLKALVLLGGVNSE